MDLALEHISVHFGNQKIVNEVSLEVKKGDFVGIIGPNGSGKSTLMRTVYRTIQPNSGAVFLGGYNIKEIKLADSAKQLGVLGQFNTVNFDFTVFEMVMMGRTPHKSMLGADTAEDYNIALDAIQKVGMEHYAHRSFASLSGGEKQRIVLARALAQLPKILVLDEPTNHLDIKYQLQILSIVKSLGIGILAVLHDLSLAAMYCNKLYVLKDGQIMAHGVPREIITPELIRDVYEIDSHISVNPVTGCLSISYHPLYQNAVGKESV